MTLLVVAKPLKMLRPGDRVVSANSLRQLQAMEVSPTALWGRAFFMVWFGRVRSMAFSRTAFGRRPPLPRSVLHHGVW